MIFLRFLLGATTKIKFWQQVSGFHHEKILKFDKIDTRSDIYSDEYIKKVPLEVDSSIPDSKVFLTKIGPQFL